MAVRGSAGVVAVAIGAAACAGAAELGLGYGLGVLGWQPTTDRATETLWMTSLTWVTWLAATATVAGASYADRFSRTPPLPDTDVDAPPEALAPTTTVLWRLVLAVAAAVGAVLTVLLVAVPARSAVRADTFTPQTVAAGYAVVGIVIGLVAAVWALASPAVRANLLATAGWVWSLAALAVVHSVITRHELGSVQPGVWRITHDTGRFWFGPVYWPGAALTLCAALVIGALAALPACRRGDSRVGVAVSGAIGPLVVAAAYFVTAPRLLGVRGDQASAFLVAPYAVITGLAGSVLVAALAQRSRRRRAAASQQSGGAAAGGHPLGPVAAGGSTGQPVAAGQPGGQSVAAGQPVTGRVPAGRPPADPVPTRDGGPVVGGPAVGGPATPHSDPAEPAGRARGRSDRGADRGAAADRSAAAGRSAAADRGAQPAAVPAGSEAAAAAGQQAGVRPGGSAAAGTTYASTGTRAPKPQRSAGVATASDAEPADPPAGSVDLGAARGQAVVAAAPLWPAESAGQSAAESPPGDGGKLRKLRRRPSADS